MSPGFKPNPTTNTFGVDQLYDKLQDMSVDFDRHIGGVLVHMFTMQDAMKILQQQPFSIKANDSWVCDCSTPDNPSCSAWTYLRTDLLPMLFSTPSWLAPTPPMEGDDCPADLNLYGAGSRIDPIPFTGKVAPPPLPSGTRGGGARFSNLLASADAKTYYSTPICGVMIDPNKMRQHITGMGAIDSATNERCCCSSDVFDREYEAFFTDLTDGSSDGSLKTAKGKPNAGCSISPGTAQCAGGDGEDAVRCRRLLSGGSIHNNNIGGHLGWDSGQKNLLNDWGSKLCVARSTPAPPPSNVFPEMNQKSCATCGYIQNCSVRDDLAPSQKSINPLPGKQWAPQYVDVEKREAGNIVGADASNLRNLFAPPVENQPPLVMDNMIIGQNMCRFAPQDWKHWIEAIKIFYDSWRAAYTKNGGELSLRTFYETMFTDTYQNYLLANPGYWYDYVENEVSMYFNADSTNSKLQDLANRQAEDFRSAIVGFFVVGGTCARHHKELESTVSNFGTYVKDEQQNPVHVEYIVQNADTRCNLFFNLDPSKQDKQHISHQIEDSSRARCEATYIQTACSYVREMAARFNETYRKKHK
jgi:hypothetical protein